jgi:hypothetical protein
MMAKKNKILFALLLAFLVINGIFLIIPKKGSSVAFDEQMFVIADTSLVKTITLISDENQIILSRAERKWSLNNAYSTDEGLIRMLLSIMQHVNVKRPVAEGVKGGTKVVFTLDGGKEEIEFTVSGNATKTKTYFRKGDQSYEVEIPGYRDYLASIFELKNDQWRDRVVFDGSWRTIQHLNLKYLENPRFDVDIAFNDKFFVVQGVAKMDSSRVVEYLNEFQNWKANERLSKGRFQKYDSLVNTTPFAELRIESINYTKEQVFYIYSPIGNDGFVLVKNQDDEMMVFDRKRISQILVKNEDFKLE